jgi:peptidoglycan/xylan/chitin deacetylase (PgdA/CDA1 family)
MMKAMIKSALVRPAVWRVLSSLLRSRGVTVLMYHRITKQGDEFAGTDAAMFRSQMQWLKSNCRPIAPHEITEAVREPAYRKPPVLVTFDDGYRDFHDVAYPFLDDLRIPALVFLATDSIDSGHMIWTDQLEWAVRRTTRADLPLPWAREAPLPLDTGEARTTVARICKDFLKQIPQAQRLALLNEIYASLGSDSSLAKFDRQMLNWAEVRATAEFAVYGAHTHNHSVLSKLSDDEADAEIRLCRDRIRDETGIAPRYFAYPNGRARDFTETTKALLRKHGFEYGFSTIEGLHRRGDDPYAIRRQYTGGSTLGDFALRVAGR